MTNLDDDSLFTNIPLGETTNIVIEKFLSENETVHKLNKDQFKCLLTIATKKYYFIFDGELQQQLDGDVMGSSMSLALANIFVFNYEDIWLFKSEIQVELFKIFINTGHSKIKFTFVNKQNKYFNCLDVKFVRENNIFTTSIYRKHIGVV